jgi:hypothetical protein
MSKATCEGCGVERVLYDGDVRHMPLYVHGSEGVMLCLECRMIPTGLVRHWIGMRNRMRLEFEKEKRRNPNGAE